MSFVVYMESVPVEIDLTRFDDELMPRREQMAAYQCSLLFD